jgi:hypothetical protein
MKINPIGHLVKTNPIQTQLKPIKANSKPNKAKTNPIKTPQSCPVKALVLQLPSRTG